MSDAVLITGCSTGLGLETALHLADRGFAVYATVRDGAQRPAVLEAAAERGVELRALELDLTDRDSVERAVGEVVAEAGGIFGLVNNGGIGLRGCLEDVSAEEVRRVFEANVFGTIAVTQAVLPHMRAAGRGRIVTITSVGGRISAFGVGVYCASKFAQEGLGEGLALELAEFGIQSVLVEPGMIRTSRWGEHRGTAAAAREPGGPYHARFTASEAIADRIVTRSPTRPADVAATIAEALTAEQPRLRYLVGRGARVVVLARRLLPERTFERLYFGGQLRRLERRTGPSAVAPPATTDPEPERVG